MPYPEEEVRDKTKLILADLNATEKQQSETTNIEVNTEIQAILDDFNAG